MVSEDEVAAMALELPEAHERPAWSLRCFRVRDKVFAALRPDLGGVAMKAAEDEIAALLAQDPQTYSVPKHYQGYSMVLAQLASADPDELRELLAESWRRTAPKRLVATFDETP